MQFFSKRFFYFQFQNYRIETTILKLKKWCHKYSVSSSCCYFFSRIEVSPMIHKNSGPVSEQHCKNSFKGLDDTQTWSLTVELQRLLLLVTQEERGQYLPGVTVLFDLEYCEILPWLWRKKEQDRFALRVKTGPATTLQYHILFYTLSVFWLSKMKKVVKTL